MTPEQIALKARREQTAALAELCCAAGEPQYEAKGNCPASGYKPAVTRRARVYSIPDGCVLVEETEIRHSRHRASSLIFLRKCFIFMSSDDQWPSAVGLRAG